MREIAAAALLMVTACAAVGSAPPGPLVGAWGGQHVGLTLDTAGGTLEYDCAAGRILQPLVPGPGGNFVAQGTHTPGHGGPDQVGQVDPSFSARYSGRVRRGTLTLTVQVENGVVIGPYTLRRGVEPTIFRCL